MRNPRDVILPGVAARWGMALPALIYMPCIFVPLKDRIGKSPLRLLEHTGWSLV